MAWVIFTGICIGALYLEAYVIDTWFWDRGRSDKPWSTIIYALIVVLLTWIFIHHGLSFWYGLLWGFCARSGFDPILNHSRDYHVCYHPDKNAYERFWRSFPCWLEISIRAVWFLSGLILFLFV